MLHNGGAHPGSNVDWDVTDDTDASMVRTLEVTDESSDMICKLCI